MVKVAAELTPDRIAAELHVFKIPSRRADTEDVKIGALPDVLNFLNIVREKKGGDLPDRQQGGDPRRQNNKREPEKEASREELRGAVAAFSADSQAQANGLSADVIEGGISGLRVVLKDRQGKVLRQLSGEEFLKMREQVAAGARGKILDQKL